MELQVQEVILSKITNAAWFADTLPIFINIKEFGPAKAYKVRKTKGTRKTTTH